VNSLVSDSQTQSNFHPFVIRDHLGTTPLPNLPGALPRDYYSIWNSLTRLEGPEDEGLGDYFDLAFEALRHKVGSLQLT
jgi:hypothetical protein